MAPRREVEVVDLVSSSSEELPDRGVRSSSDEEESESSSSSSGDGFRIVTKQAGKEDAAPGSGEQASSSQGQSGAGEEQEAEDEAAVTVAAKPGQEPSASEKEEAQPVAEKEEDAPLAAASYSDDAQHQTNAAAEASSEEDEGLQRAVEGTVTDDEQEDKEIKGEPDEAGPRQGKDQELQALLLQDLTTLDPSEEGGYARRRVAKGSVVLVRGEDGAGATLTWVALVNKVYRWQAKYLVDVAWFYRKADVPAAAAQRAGVTLSDDPRQLLFTNDTHTVEAKFIRHPAQAWFLAPDAPDPSMRCGQGQHRHTRHRPGFLVRHVFDKQRKQLHPISDLELPKTNPQLAHQVERLHLQSKRQLEELRREEAAYDARTGLERVDAAPFGQAEDEERRRQATAAARAAEEPSTSASSSTPSEDDEDSSEEEGSAQQAAAATAKQLAATTATAAAEAAAREQRQRRQRQQTERVEEQARQARRHQQENVDLEAAKLASLLPQEGATPPSGSLQAEPQVGLGSPTTASGAWKRCAHHLLRQAGELPRRTAPPPAKDAVQSPRNMEASQVETLAKGATLPSAPQLAALLRAICSATEAAARELLDQLMFLRVLVTWLWALTAALVEQQPHTPEAEECAVLVLRALERCPYTHAAHRWICLVCGNMLIRVLAQNSERSYPVAVQQAAAHLKAGCGQRLPAWWPGSFPATAAIACPDLWWRRYQELQRQRQERQQQRQDNERQEQRQEQRQDQQQDRQEQRLLRKSPQAARALSLATSGRRLSALGAGGGGATYVRSRQSPQPMRMPAAAAPPSQQPDRRLGLPPRPNLTPGAQQQPAAPRDAPVATAATPARNRQQTQATPPARQEVQKQQQRQQQQPADDLSARWRSAFGSGQGQPTSPRGQHQGSGGPSQTTQPSQAAGAGRAQAPAAAPAGGPGEQPAAGGSGAGQKRPAPDSGGKEAAAGMQPAAKVARREVRAEAAPKPGKGGRLSALLKKANKSRG